MNDCMGGETVVKLNDHEFEELCKFMSTSYGINLTKKRVLIEYRLMNELKQYGIDSFQEYLNLLHHDRSGKMKEGLVNRITTNYTFFMRESSHFQYITEHILPQADSTQPFQIWIAGCSSGQECYTLAMYIDDLRRKGCILPKIVIKATDISSKVLKEAELAEYPIEAMETLPELWRNRYCLINEDKKTFRIHKSIRDIVSFHYHNLMEPYKRNTFDLVMCRNVMIYFDDASRKLILTHLKNSMRTRGYLILGHAEMIPYYNSLFQYHGSSIYQKKDE